MTLTESMPEISIENEMRKSYLDYAMSVIIGRALPDVRDGLKPVHRRVLYAMRELKNDWNKPYKKSARVVGDCFVKGTLVHTETGLRPIEAMAVGDTVLLPDGATARVEEIFHNIDSDIVRVEMGNGYPFRVTPGQLFRVLNPDLTIGWERADQLREGQTVLISSPRIRMNSLAVHPDAKLSAMAYVMGLLVAEGYLTDRRRGSRVGIRMTDPEPLDFLFDVCIASGISPRWSHVPPRQPHHLRQDGLRFSGFPQAAAVCADTSADKTVPGWILADRRLYALFLAGFADGDGHFHVEGSRREAVFTSASQTLLVQIQAMLADSGIHCTLTCEDFENRAYGENSLPRYNLWISGEAASRFSDLVKDYLQVPKKRQLAEKMTDWNRRTLNCDFASLPARTIFEELSARHLGGGWYRDREGRKFRAGLKYSTGCKIRYEKGLAEKSLSFRQIEEFGILTKLDRIGSALAPRLRHLMETYHLTQVRSVRKETAPEDTYDIRIDSPEHEFLAQGFAVHNCIGKYHPHGDTAVYDTIVRMTQDFSLRYPLVDGQGNFGSIDGDSAAAMRYTEVRMAKISHEMLADLDKETVDVVPNYDESLTEPSVLPAKLPCLLVNGSSGIAVGMATNIPPHNLNEVIEAVRALIDNPEIGWQELMQYIPGPDFPTAAIIYGTTGIYEAYKTGRGIIRLRARAVVETDKATGQETIIVNEIPYQVNKARLIEKIADLVKNKQIEGIRFVRDESDREGMRIAIGLKKDQVAEVIVNQLYKHTQMETSFGIIFLAVVNSRPQLFTLKEMLEQFILHRKDVIIRRTKYDLRKAEERAHILEGLKIALDNLDEAISLIRSSKSTQEARDRLIGRFSLTTVQAQAILDMRLQRLTGLERDKIIEEYENVLKDIAWFREILSSERLVLNIVKEELAEIQTEFGDERRTEIVEATRELTIEDMIMEEDMVVTISKNGYIKRTPITQYQSQRRGGKGKTAMGMRDEDFVELLFVASTHHTFLFFTNQGRVYWSKVYEIPQASRTSMGRAIVNFLNFEKDERLSTVLAVPKFEEGQHIIMATRQGLVKKTDIMAYSRPRSGGIIALNLVEGDELIAARITDGTYNVFLGSASGKSIQFPETDVRVTGRVAQGVRGMTLLDNDYIVGMEVLSHSGQTFFTATEHGYGKRTLIDEYPLQKRGGKGVITIKTSKRNGRVIAILLVSEDDDLMLMTDRGKLIRMPVNGISVISRNTQGVKLIGMEPDERVIGAARLAEKEEEAEETEEAEEAEEADQPEEE